MSLIDNSKEKMIHAMIFFVKNTKHCHKTKLFKLLYFLDFEIYRKTGRSVTGLDYYAWEKGPVPIALFNMINKNDPDLHKAIEIAKTDKRVTFDPKIPMDEDLFSINEMEAMKTFAKIFKDENATRMIEISHGKEKLWDRVYNKEGSKKGPIPYHYILEDHRHLKDTISKEEADERKQFDEAMVLNFG